MLLTSVARPRVAPTRGPGEDVVSVRGAAFGYDRRPVVTGVDLTLHRGDVVAVRGANGSGKSALVRGLLGLAPLLAGQVDLFGRPQQQLRDRSRIGYVPQRHTVATTVPVTVRELVSSGRLSLPRHRRRPWQRFGEADRCAVDCALEGVGLAGYDRRQLSELSGGEQRRALVARALAGDPELLVLDEPIAGVDAANQRVLAATIAGLAASGTTVLAVLHELGPLAPVVHRVTALPSAGERC
ncbi:ATP-binding cassette domain-containing protein [Modestobacter sp. I12A-02628]|uniref:ATP-binding cassette domain-containing protein n=1 Tax=Goekera deserti TaxID=2497753 RepID=A0A7K3WDJ9_9ACTN|nr:ATP-binding cassette domain-containing protein [Goekera deserti]MPQ97171.1 ATP-binding cassette domain-containing protein [Goekera deserti]NDI46511.1 ATP-binding cassette domain-containing protein [Goekera deserti]NEL54555.1 ATP-binding cassette domain-containing protein [Goekera deserti]